MEESAQRLLSGDRRTLSRLITLLEQGNIHAIDVLKSIDPNTGKAYVIGVTGPPGAGKSTIVDRLTELVRSQGLTAAVVGVDPSSPFSGGAFLGDRIRMQRHSLDSGVFIRSVASRGHSGGLPRVVNAVVRLLDASGSDVIFVETVGVGQSELAVHDVADTVLVALMPESGDAVQALKAGVMEIADIFLVNKADRDGASQMAAVVTGALQLVSDRPDWTPPVLLTTANSGQGILDLWDKIREHREYLTSESLLTRRRSQRRQREFLETVEDEMARRFRELAKRDPEIVTTLTEVAEGKAEPYSAALRLLDSRRSQADWLIPLSAGPD